MNLKQLYARVVFWPTWGWNLLLGRVLKTRAWCSEVAPGLFLGARPLMSDVPRLAARGITHIVNTCEEFCGFTEQYEKVGIRQLHLPITDFQPPTLPEIDTATSFIDAAISAGGKVLVHCKAGRARSATIVLCWLMKRNGWTAGEAQAHLLQCRPHVNRRLAGRQVVEEFAQRLRPTSRR
jgi:atypical dual specificity phosphatase